MWHGAAERERCLLDLAEWLDAAVEHGGLVALVEGEAGIGKTALLQEFSAQQRRVGRVLWGACDALFTPRPLGPLHDIARQTQKALLAAIAAGNRDAIFTAALDELERGPPALVVLEDLHWADDATLDLFKFLSRRIHRTHALLVITYRDDELGPRHPLRFVLGELPRGGVRRLRLVPLSESAVTELADNAGRPATGLRALTGGNPFFLTELLAAGTDAVPAEEAWTDHSAKGPAEHCARHAPTVGCSPNASGLPASRHAACGSSSRVRARDIPCMHGTMLIAYRHAV